MRILIAGGTGMIGMALTKSLLVDGHQVWVLTRNPRGNRLPDGVQAVGWQGETGEGLSAVMGRMDAVVNLVGERLAHWPWTRRQKQRFLDSRVDGGRALSDAIRDASPRPKTLIQASGINHYGLRGGLADESTPPGDDFLARLTVAWEASTQEVETIGVRRCVIRTAVVLAPREGLFQLMALPVRLFVGGPLGNGRQVVPWVHVADVVGAIRHLLGHAAASGPFNLIAPDQTSNAEFYRLLARALRRPYWFPTPAFLLRRVLGEMSVLVLEGRAARPVRLLEIGYQFQFDRLEPALRNLLG